MTRSNQMLDRMTTLHDWPEHEPAFRAAAKHWGRQQAVV